MDISEFIKDTENCLVVCSAEDLKQVHTLMRNFTSVQVKTSENLGETAAESKDHIFIYYPKKTLNGELASQLINISKAGSKLIFYTDSNELDFVLKTSGFINISKGKDSIITCEKPSYELGSVQKINLKKAPTVWKIDDGDEDEEELIDSDKLLDENDLKRPDPSSLKVCGTTGKRKACKNCSCGLAEELSAEAKANGVDTTDLPKSSCNNCYLGDAFRCASCPYLGMPAFKPGEKIQLTDSQLKSDI